MSVYDRILIGSGEIEQCIERLAREICKAYDPGDVVLAVVILQGAARFAEDLFEKMGPLVEVAFIRAASYHGQTSSGGEVSLEGEICGRVTGRRVLIIDDIYDTGRTLDAVIRWVTGYGAADVKTCVLLEKDRPHEIAVAIDFVGTRVEDVFLIGYGLDYQGRYRDLPFVAAMRPADDAESGQGGG